MIKHTPGPWSYDNEENEVHSDSMQNSGGDPAHICEMIGTNWAANGHLIAAAPEMLEALKEAEHELDVNYIAYMNKGPGFEAIEKIIRKCRAAIAKAEGRANE